MSASKPRWIRLDVNVLDNPKVISAIGHGGHQAFTLWVQGLAYSAQHLTDGWVPKAMPARWGHKPRQTDALVAAELWWEVPLNGDSGWLINDFDQYQPTRQDWESKSEKRRQAAMRSWANR